MVKSTPEVVIAFLASRRAVLPRARKVLRVPDFSRALRAERWQESRSYYHGCGQGAGINFCWTVSKLEMKSF